MEEGETVSDCVLCREKVGGGVRWLTYGKKYEKFLPLVSKYVSLYSL